MKTETKHFTKPEGYGYWDLSFYPWGGSFKRLKTERELPIIEVIDTYKTGEPRKVTSFLDGAKVGFEL